MDCNDENNLLAMAFNVTVIYCIDSSIILCTWQDLLSLFSGQNTTEEEVTKSSEELSEVPRVVMYVGEDENPEIVMVTEEESVVIVRLGDMRKRKRIADCQRHADERISKRRSMRK